MTGRTWVFDVDCCGRPLTHNAAKELHPAAAQRERQAWRNASATLARQVRIPKLACVEITVQAHYPDRRSWPDPDGIYPSVKGIIDGLVQAQVLPDDRGEFVRCVAYMRPVLWPDRNAGITVKIEEVSDADA